MIDLNKIDGKQRVVIENVQPEIDNGLFAIKRIEGESVKVSANIFADGHDRIQAYLLFRKKGERSWQKTPMEMVAKDLWQGKFTVNKPGIHEYTIEALVDHLTTWWEDIQKKATESNNLTVDLKCGLSLLASVVPKIEEIEKKTALQKLITLIQRGEKKDQEEIIDLLDKNLDEEVLKKYPLPNHITRYDKILRAVVDRNRAGFSAWYELFPRSCSAKSGTHGTFQD
ncbi:MAG: maltotransferase domain-containing protein, partial [Atribacterota bacterium]